MGNELHFLKVKNKKFAHLAIENPEVYNNIFLLKIQGAMKFCL